MDADYGSNGKLVMKVCIDFSARIYIYYIYIFTSSGTASQC